MPPWHPPSAQKAERASSKSGKGKAAAAPSMADELTELQGILERLWLEKEIKTKGKQQERLQVELKKMQRIKEFKPTMVCTSIDLLHSLSLSSSICICLLDSILCH
jgi:hypothetical protein